MKGLRRIQGLRPFFTYFGGKHRIAHLYPRPLPSCKRLIEPFAGSAGYACRYPDREVTLCDLDEKVIGTWRYLISVKESEILRLPINIDHVDEMKGPQEAKWLVGWWFNKGMNSPCNLRSTWAKDERTRNSFWGGVIRHKIASQLRHVRHWKIIHGTYADLEDIEATWFVDPPYDVAGDKYRHGKDEIDYSHLSQWCQSRQGRVIVCENVGADWLPFRPFVIASGGRGKNYNGKSHESLFYRSE